MSPIQHATECEMFTITPSVSELWCYIMTERSVTGEHNDVWAKLTFDHLDIKCHHSLFYPVGRLGEKKGRINFKVMTKNLLKRSQ